MPDEQSEPRTQTVDAALRAWTTTGRRGNGRSADHSSSPEGPIRDILVIDTETTVDAAQALTFGGWMHARVAKSGQVSVLSEGLFHADDLPETDPSGYAALVEYTRSREHSARTDSRDPESSQRLTLTTRTKFVETTLFKLGYRARAHLVMFNKPFDISRLALDAGESRGTLPGGFSFRLWENDMYRPRVRVKHLDPRKSLTSFSLTGAPVEGWVKGSTNHGNFLDLRTWAFALTNTSHTLESACRTFGVEHGKTSVEQHGTITADYVEYCRNDVRATTELFAKLYAEHRRHPIGLDPTRTMSPASVAKAYLVSMGLTPRLDRDSDMTDTMMARVMSTYYGARSEVRIRHTVVPVEHHDFTSMYPTVNTLMGLWPLLTSQRIAPVDSTSEVQAFLDSLTLDSLFDPNTWPKLVGIAEIVPDNDVLPIRAKYADHETHTISVSPTVSDRPLWYSLPDLAASAILTGQPPRVRSAFRFVGEGTLPNLCPVRLRGEVDVDPTRDDFFRLCVERRQDVKRGSKGHRSDCRCEACSLAEFLKVLANAGSYGIFVEMTPNDLPSGAREDVTVHAPDGSSFTASVPGAEEPGRFCYPPLATCITGAARLMLAMLERCVTDLGGSWAFADTDSLSIVADATGSLVPCDGGEHTDGNGRACVRALTYGQTEGIRHRFAGLSPYDPTAVRDMLKEECRAFCFAVSAKRYALFTHDSDGRVTLADGKWTKHGLGHVFDPRTERTDFGYGWIADYWAWLIASALRMSPVDPEWFALPAVGRSSVTSPTLLRRFNRWNAGRSYADKVKPFNFMSTAFVKAGSHLTLIAPYERDPDRWCSMEWTDLHDNGDGFYRLSTDFADQMYSGVAYVQSYADLVRSHYSNPEVKYLGPNGEPCGRETRGWLSRGTVRVGSVTFIGKESNRLDESEDGLLVEDPTVSYCQTDGWDGTLRLLSRLTPDQIAERVNTVANAERRRITDERKAIRERQAKRSSARLTPHENADTASLDDAETRIVTVSVQHVRSILRGQAPGDQLADALARVVSNVAPTQSTANRTCGCGCGSGVTGRFRFVSDAHRMRYRRKDKTEKTS